ncbi:cullin family protein [Cystoisospora suis]|uniref:Cullin family protein n=1 Tax=Cystoisospora suis TaxID=483139 RepID=A0A2C6L745_9APIC|nr:cullin family protein [Cystoisospora suis]
MQTWWTSIQSLREGDFPSLTLVREKWKAPLFRRKWRHFFTSVSLPSRCELPFSPLSQFAFSGSIISFSLHFVSLQHTFAICFLLPGWVSLSEVSTATIGEINMMRQAFDTQPAYSSSSSCLSSSRRPRIANFFEDGASTDFHRRPTSLERNWELLRSAIDKAFSGYDDLASLSASSRAAIKNKQALYMSVEELVLEGYSQPLLVRLFAYLDEKVSHVVTSLYQHLRTVQDLSFLGIVAASWTAFLRSLHEVVQVFSYLERHVVAYTPDSSIVEVAESMWLRHQGQCGADFNSTLLNFILEAIRLHRTGDHTWEEALRTVIRMLFTLGLYTKALQPRLLEASSLFYREEGDHLTKEMSLVDYACHVEKRLIEEDSRVDAFLVPPSREPLLDVVRKHLIEDHEDFLLTIDVLKQLTKNRETLHLRRLYILFSQIDALDLLKTRFLETVKVMGLELLESLQKASSSSSSGGGATTGGRQEREEEEEEEEGGGVSRKDDVESSSEGNRTAWVGRLLDLKETHDVVWATAFCQNQEFHLGIKETWEKFLNQDVSAMKLVTRLLGT